MKFSFHFPHKKIKGFTLVEILVVLGIFSFLMTLATGVLYMTQAVNVKLQETQAILDNVNFAVDTIARDIRYGIEFHCGSEYATSSDVDYKLRKDCSYDDFGNNVLFFKSVNGTTGDNSRVVYYASTTSNGHEVVWKDEYNNSDMLIASNQITSDDIAIKNLSFYVEGAYTKDGDPLKNVLGKSDYKQPLITILLSGETVPIVHNSSSTKFSIQSTITSHRIDK